LVLLQKGLRDRIPILILLSFSPNFKGKKMMEVQGTLAGLLGQYLAGAEVIGYSSDEFQSASPETFIGEIKRTGKILYAS